MSNKNEAIKVAVEALRLLVQGQSSAEILDNLGLNDDYLLELADALESSIEESDDKEKFLVVSIEVSSENALETSRDTEIIVNVYETDGIESDKKLMFWNKYTGYTLKYVVDQMRDKFNVSRNNFSIWELNSLARVLESRFDSIFA